MCTATCREVFMNENRNRQRANIKSHSHISDSLFVKCYDVVHCEQNARYSPCGGEDKNNS